MKRKTNMIQTVNKEEEMAKSKKVVVTTQHRGVFFGELIESDAPKSLKLKNAKNCVYWSSSLHGFVGLATSGPESGCKIGPAVSELELYDITAILVCTKEAVKKWEGELWG